MRRMFFTAILLYMFQVFSHGFDLEVKEQGGVAGRIYGTAFFDGHPVNCFIDTGANTSSIFLDSFTAKYKSISKSRVLGASGQYADVDNIMIKNMRIDKHSRLDIKINRSMEKGAPDGSRGIVGADFFQDSAFLFDIRNKKIICGHRPAASGPVKSFPLIKNDDNYILFYSNISGRDVLSIFDTGAGLTTVDASLKKADPALFTFIQKMNDVRDANDRIVTSVELHKLKSVKIGDARFNDVYVLVSDISLISAVGRNIRFIVGYNIISQKKWHLDMKKLNFRILE